MCSGADDTAGNWIDTHGFGAEHSAGVFEEVRATAASATAAQVVPANRLTVLEQARTLRVVNSPDVVNLPPLQIYARLLDDGIYIGSVSTIYRILAENR